MRQIKDKREYKKFYRSSLMIASIFVFSLCGRVSYSQTTPASAEGVQKFEADFTSKDKTELDNALKQSGVEVKATATDTKTAAPATLNDDKTKAAGTLDTYVGNKAGEVAPTTVIGADGKVTVDNNATEPKPELQGQVTAPPKPKKLVVLPETDWKVREIPRKGVNGIAYCSLSKNFKSGQTLFLSRDASMSNTIAIDLQNDIMEVGRQYVVILKTGEVNKRLTAIAATPKILIMKTGAGNDIYDEFVKARSATFRLGADNLEFKFSASIINALNKLTDCATALKVGKTFRGQEIAKSDDKNDSASTTVSNNANKQSKALPPAIAAKNADKEEDRISPKRDEVADISTRLVNKKGLKDFLQKKSHGLGLIKSPEQVVTQPSDEQLESFKEEVLREDLEQKKQLNQLAKTIRKLRDENKKLAEDNKNFKIELEKQKLQTADSQNVVNKTKKEMLEEINELRKTQKTLALQDAEIQKNSQTIILDTQNKQMEIIAEIKRLTEENEKLKNSTVKDKSANMQMIAKNQVEVERLREANLRLALQQELEDEVRKKKEIKNEMEKNHIRSELMRLKAENTQLMMDFETGKSDVIWKTEQIKQQQQDIADAAKIEWENTKDFASVAYDTQQKLLEETEKLKFENQRLKQLTEKEKDETKRLSEESARKQDEINAEIERMKKQNADMMARIKQVKEQSAALQQVQDGYIAPTPLFEGAENYLGVPQNSNRDNLKKWLYVSGAAGSSYIEVEENAGGTQKLYRWQDNGIYGIAKEIPDISSTSINKVVSDYINDMSKNCKGDFAKTSGNVKLISPYEVLEAETACMGKKSSSAAVILFVLGRDKINIITQETSPGNINVAIENRDKIEKSIR